MSIGYRLTQWSFGPLSNVSEMGSEMARLEMRILVRSVMDHTTTTCRVVIGVPGKLAVCARTYVTIVVQRWSGLHTQAPD